VNAAQLGGLPASSYATQTGFNSFSKQQAFLGNGLWMYTGDPLCGSGFAGFGFGQLTCTSYAMIGNITDLFLNRPSSGTMHFRENNVDEMTILPGGLVMITSTDGPALDARATHEGENGIQALGGGGSSSGFVIGGAGISSQGGKESTSNQYSNGGSGVIANGGTGNAGGAGITAFGGNGTSIMGEGIYASTFDPSASSAGAAGYFDGDVHVSGRLSKAGGSFKIDHPLDPANKYLYHSFVESPDMMNIYNGVVVLDGSGEAVVELPEWFEVLNKDFRYQLTAIGAPGPNLYIAAKVANNRFRIAGGQPGMEVSWQVTGIRQDAWANAHRIPVEVEKSERERGYFIHPELYGGPEEKGIPLARHPEMMRRMKARQASMPSQSPKP